MAVGLEHPLVADYLRRLDAAATVLPPGRRGELVEEIRTHVADALDTIGDDEASVRGILDRLGEPQDIVGAESVEPQHEVVAPSTARSWSGAARAPDSAPTAVRTPWSTLEIVAVLGLTVGSVLLPLVGPLVGLVCAWASTRWTHKEKIIATAWTALAPVLVVVMGLSLFMVRSSEVLVEPSSVANVVESAEVVPVPTGPSLLEPVPSPEVSR